MTSESEGSFAKVETAEHVVPHPMLGLSQGLRRPNWSELSTRDKEHNGAVRRQDENSLLALYCLTTSHAFDWDRASVIGKGDTKHTRYFIETPPPHVKHSIPAPELYATIGGD